MTIKSDKWISYHSLLEGMIEPFSKNQNRFRDEDGVTNRIISYGLSSYGYDLRCVDEFKVFSVRGSAAAYVDPKAFDGYLTDDISGLGYCMIPPNSFALTRSLERIKMPEDTLGICVGKSTYARCGIVVNTTPLEPGWEGHLTIELSNTTPLPAKVYANEGICQLLFFQSDERCRTSYRDRAGKYMGQVGITLPEV